MAIKTLLTSQKKFVLTLIFICSFTLGWGQNAAKDTTTYEIGNIGDALYASMIPDNHTVGVYLSVGKQNKLLPSEWASTVEKYFKAYGFPVKIILDSTRTNGKSAVAAIYIGAKRYQGNLSGGGVGLYHLFNNHKEVFTELLALYKKANPDMTFNQD